VFTFDRIFEASYLYAVYHCNTRDKWFRLLLLLANRTLIVDCNYPCQIMIFKFGKCILETIA